MNIEVVTWGQLEYCKGCERLTGMLKWLWEDNIQFYLTVTFVRTGSGWNWISTVCFNSEVRHWWTCV